MSDDNQSLSHLPTTPLAEPLPVAAGIARSPILMKLDAAAAELQCTRRSLERQIAAGRITAIHIGRSVRIEHRELEAFVDRLREEAQSKTCQGASASRDPDWANPHPERREVHGQTA
jgi:excisionase family DNA binding protein